MIGLDANVLARYFVAEADAETATETQRQAARQLSATGRGSRLVPQDASYSPPLTLTPELLNRVAAVTEPAPREPLPHDPGLAGNRAEQPRAGECPARDIQEVRNAI